MADFCRQCSADQGFDGEDLAGITTKDDEAQGLAAVVICEGCGVVQVDHEGNCLGGCLEKHEVTRR